MWRYVGSLLTGTDIPSPSTLSAEAPDQKTGLRALVAKIVGVHQFQAFAKSCPAFFPYILRAALGLPSLCGPRCHAFKFDRVLQHWRFAAYRGLENRSWLGQPPSRSAGERRSLVLLRRQ